VLTKKKSVLKETSHRATELKDLGWSVDEIARYVELWDYRQRWGAINLEREDRQFLRKAEAALPEIKTGKVSLKKPTQEKSYYRRIKFFLDSMIESENSYGLSGSRGVWAILLEEELRALDYYEPVLGLPDTIKAKALEEFREEFVEKLSEQYKADILIKSFDFNSSLQSLQSSEKNNWRALRADAFREDKAYPLVKEESVEGVRELARDQLLPKIKSLLPSLTDTDKQEPPNDWSRD
tara:strand:+ start:4281 stop:4994 length:714 start_codon:yes stop_codon:yes gene_type:complete